VDVYERSRRCCDMVQRGFTVLVVTAYRSFRWDSLFVDVIREGGLIGRGDVYDTMRNLFF